jgi:hypothetical protein
MITRIAFNFLLAIFCLMGIALTAVGSRELLHLHSAQSWQKVAGTVRFAEIIESHGRSTTWCPKWTYQYTVNGQEYFASRTAVGTVTCQRYQQWAEAKLKQHPVGASVDVYFDPENPASAALSIAPDGGIWWFVSIVGIGFILVALKSMVAIKKANLQPE